MSHARLHALATAWERQRLAGHLLASLGVGVAGAAMAWRASGSPASVAGAGVAVAGIALALARHDARRHPRTARDVARHLDRTVPALEESTELLLDDAPGGATRQPDALAAQLQRATVAARLDAIAELPPLPNHAWRRSLRVAAAALFVAGAVATLGRGAAATGDATAARPDDPLRVESLRLAVAPPAYLGVAAYSAESLDVQVPEGSRLTWALRTNRRAGHAILTLGTDTVPFVDGSSPREATATALATTAALYELHLGDSAAGGVHRLGVVADSAPVVRMETPEGRTTLLPGDSHRIPVRLRVEDDHGLGGAELVLTLTHGKGESVKFRETRRPMEGASGRTAQLTAMLDLDALGLVPGDELYLRAEARDRRQPTPNVGRSETVFIAIPDTAEVARALLGGIAVDRMPAYFRSQRQIILDTEKLLRDKDTISVESFRQRSADIGYDQYLLRQRYGALIGAEERADEEELGAAHEHDMAENATLLANSVKATLKLAVGEMFESERRLRTYEPRAALPFAYKALTWLKEIQQASRVYVQRVAFDPPPLDEPTKRLSGELDKVSPAGLTRASSTRDSLAGAREALAALERAEAATPLDAAARAALERGGRDLARLALEQPGRHLAGLAALRALLRAATPGACGDCVARARAALWSALPAPGRAPTAAAGDVARRRRLAEALDAR